jgi:carbon monoxide dehydrogenase subunit G
MAIRLNGDFVVKRRPEEVYDFLTDPQKFGALLPDTEGLVVQDATHFAIKAKVRAGFVRGTAEVKMELAEADRPRRAKYQGQGSVPGGGMALTAEFDLSPSDGGTKVAWQGETQLSGALAFGGSFLESMARKNQQKLIDSLRGALEQGIPL